jgi:acyl carrier protein
MISAMTGQRVTGPQLTATYWYESLRAPVEFSRAVQALAGDHGVFIEVSPHPVLTGALTETLDDTGHSPAVTGTLRRDDGGPARLMTSLAAAYVAGVPVDWAVVLGGGRRVELPTYAFQRQRYWPAAGVTAEDVRSAGLGTVGHPFLGAVTELPAGRGLLFTGLLSARTQPWLADHAVAGTVLLPGTAFVELAFRAGQAAGCTRVEELTLESPLALPADRAVQIQVLVGEAEQDGQRSVEIYARQEGESWTRHASGQLAAAAGLDMPGELTIWPPEGAVPVPVDGLYDGAAADVYGPSFRGLRAAWRRGQDIFASIRLPERGDLSTRSFGIHPALLDAATHAAWLSDAHDPGVLFMPFAWTGVSLHEAGAAELRVRVRRDAVDRLSLTAADAAGVPVVSVGSLVLRPVKVGQVAAADAAALRDTLFTVEWEAIPVSSAAPTGTWAVVGDDPLNLASEIADLRSYPDLTALEAAIGAGDQAPEVVLAYAGSSAVPDSTVPDSTVPDSTVADTARAAAGHALTLMQRWLRADALAAARLVLVTAGAVAANPAEGLADLAGAAVWGLVRSAQTENPGCLTLADLPGRDRAGTGALLVQAIGSAEPEVVVRDGRVFGRRLARPAAVADPEGTRRAGTVLITGGTGTLGGVVAGHLAATGRADQVLLASRSGPAAPGTARLTASVAAQGAQVRVVACDVGNRSALAGLIASVPVSMPLTMVVHAAGILDDGVIESLTPDRVGAVMRPKADAAWHLHELTRNADLDAFIVFSSMAVTFGGPGQGSYNAANGFLDGLAGHRRAMGLPGTSLAWGPWLHRTGIGRNLDEDMLGRISRGGVAELSAQEGLDLFDLAIRAPEALLIPARLDVAGLRAEIAAGAETPVLWRRLIPRVPGPAATPAAGETLRKRLAGLPAAERGKALLNLVRAHVAAVLRHASGELVAPEQAFTDLGFDSLTAVDLRNQLHTATGMRLPATLVFDYPNPAALAGYLLAKSVEQDTDYLPVLEQLDRLESILSPAVRSGVGKPKIKARLEALLRELHADPPDSAESDRELAAATDAEMFELIEGELRAFDDE